ncbi:MAG: hypothetical protein LBJ78_04165 [Puniceicoccales bacterium]|jgi:hypothetical protein|nr:hypothetical protein [Puniceicoccales bacterium]
MNDIAFFINQWRHSLAEKIASFSEGLSLNLKQQFEVSMNPDEVFLHMLCRKIDIAKKIYQSYDDMFLKPTSDVLLQSTGWECVLFLFATHLSNLQFNTDSFKILGYKWINTLLKAQSLMPSDLQQNVFVQKLYTELLPQWLL